MYFPGEEPERSAAVPKNQFCGFNDLCGGLEEALTCIR